MNKNNMKGGMILYNNILLGLVYTFSILSLIYTIIYDSSDIKLNPIEQSLDKQLDKQLEKQLEKQLVKPNQLFLSVQKHFNEYIRVLDNYKKLLIKKINLYDINNIREKYIESVHILYIICEYIEKEFINKYAYNDNTYINYIIRRLEDLVNCLKLNININNEELNYEKYNAKVSLDELNNYNII